MLAWRVLCRGPTPTTDRASRAPPPAGWSAPTAGRPFASSRSACTRIGPAGSFRAIGGPQAVWAGESQIDELARDVGLDPVEMRRRNLVGRGQRPQPGPKPMETDLPADLDRLVRDGAGDGGVALATSDAGAGPVATALVRLHGDGSVTLMTAGTEMGQGSQTVLAQIAAGSVPPAGARGDRQRLQPPRWPRRAAGLPRRSSSQ